MSQISSRCQGHQLSKSAQCNQTAFCCFTSLQASTSTVSPTGLPSNQQCTPNTAPDVNNGMCVRLSQISTCQGMRISKSLQCLADQYCCFSTQSYSTSSATSEPFLTTSVTSVTTVTPNSNSTGSTKYPSDLNAPALPENPSRSCTPVSYPTVSGHCVDKAQVSAQCQGGRISQSSQCMPYQYCCFGQPLTTPTVLPPTTPRSTSAPVSAMSTRAPTREPPVYYDNNYPPYGSLNVNPFVGCTPLTEPSVTNGVCVDSAQLTNKCMFMKASKSPNCAPYQYCCFNGTSYESPTDPYYESETVTITTESSSRDISCRPTTEPSVTNGVCVTESRISTRCKAQRISKSIDCLPDQYCCFSGDAGNDVGATQYNQRCSPSSEPSVTDGTCTDKQHLSSSCRSLVFSKSIDCQQNQFCCFTRLNSSANTNGNGQSKSRRKLILTAV